MAVTHPRLERWEYEALQADAGWAAPLEHLDGQAVVSPPVGGAHGSAHVALPGFAVGVTALLGG